MFYVSEYVTEVMSAGWWIEFERISKYLLISFSPHLRARNGKCIVKIFAKALSLLISILRRNRIKLIILTYIYLFYTYELYPRAVTAVSESRFLFRVGDRY